MKAFTLLEVLVVSLLVGFLGVGTMYVLVNTNKITSDNYIHTMTNTSTNLILSEISKDVKEGVFLESISGGVIIHYLNKSDVTWSNLNKNIVRSTDENNKNYVIYGSRSSDYTLDAIWLVNQYGSGKYHRLDVIISYVENDATNYKNTKIKDTFYCRKNSILYKP